MLSEDIKDWSIYLWGVKKGLKNWEVIEGEEAYGRQGVGNS